MIITDFTHSHIEQAQQLAKQNYEEERGVVPALPSLDDMPNLTELADNNMGVAAFDGDKMLGFLCSISPFEKTFQIPNLIGAYSPLHAHATVNKNRAEIYARMYQAVAEKWVKAGALNHAIVFMLTIQLPKHGFFNMDSVGAVLMLSD